jgi:hypothetical protein
MKRTIEFIVVLLIWLLFGFYTAAQVNDQPPQPISPTDRISPTQEPNNKAQLQPITLKVAGANLRDDQGAPIGRVEDIVVDPASGRIDLLIVSAFFPTNSTKLMAIPWKAITYRAEQSGLTGVPGANQVFALNFPRTKLQQAPTFERYRWPDMSQAGWRQPIYEFYTVKGTEAIGATGNGTHTQSGVGTGVGPNTSTGPTADPSVPAGVNRTNQGSLRTNALPIIPAAPGINRLPGSQSQTNSPSGQRDDLRNQPPTPDNRLPVGKRL